MLFLKGIRGNKKKNKKEDKRQKTKTNISLKKEELKKEVKNLKF